MNLIKVRLLAIGVAIVLVGSIRFLKAIGLEYAFEDCALAAFAAVVVVTAADFRS